MATDTRAGGAKARAESKGLDPKAADIASTPAADAPGDDEAIMGPLWARMAIGAAAVVVIAAAAQLALAKGTTFTTRGESRVDKLVAFVLVLATPFFVNFAASVAADLSRGVPRVTLAALTGTAAVVTAFVTFAMISALSYFVAPLALIGGPLLRAVTTRSRAGMRRADHLLEWAFAGVFWPTLIAVGAGFLIRANVLTTVAAGAGVKLSASTSLSLSVALGAAFLGAILTWMYAVLDAGLWSNDPSDPSSPDEVAPPGPEVAEHGTLKDPAPRGS